MFSNASLINGFRCSTMIRLNFSVATLLVSYLMWLFSALAKEGRNCRVVLEDVFALSFYSVRVNIYDFLLCAFSRAVENLGVRNAVVKKSAFSRTEQHHVAG